MPQVGTRTGEAKLVRGWVSFLFFGPNGLRAGWGLIVFVIAVFVIAAALSLVLPLSVRSRDAQSFLGEVTLTVAVAAATAAMALIEHRSVWAYGLAGPHSRRRFVQGAVSGLILLSGLVGMLFATGHLEFTERLLNGTDILPYGLAAAGFFVVVALGE